MVQKRNVKVDGEEAGQAEVIPPRRGASSLPEGLFPEGMGDDPIVRLVATLMDNAFKVPGTQIRFGLDPVLGLLPGLGDSVGSLISVGLIGISARYGLPRIVLIRMALNVLINGVIGAIPIFGDAFSIWFKSNAMNHRLLVQHAGPQRASTTGDWVFVGGLMFGVLFLIGLAFYGLFTLLGLLF